VADTIDDIPLLDDHFDTSFSDQRWMDTGESRSSSWFLGEDLCGPMVYLLDSASPSTSEPRFPVHHHGSDELRLVVTGALRVGRTWLHPGQLRMQKAGGDYGPETTGPDGCQELVLFADRRGFMPEYPRQQDQAALGWLAGYFQTLYADHFPASEVGEAPRRYHSVLGSSVDASARHGRVDASFDDPSWPLENGVRYSFWAMGAEPQRPLILLVESAVGAPVVPPVRFPTDQFRMMLTGSCEIGGQCYRAGDIRVQQAGHLLGPEVTGPGGSRQIVVFARQADAAPMFSDRDEAARVTGPLAALGGDVGALLRVL
jgi:hypothetical protein